MTDVFAVRLKALKYLMVMSSPFREHLDPMTGLDDDQHVGIVRTCMKPLTSLPHKAARSSHSLVVSFAWIAFIFPHSATFRCHLDRHGKPR